MPDSLRQTLRTLQPGQSTILPVPDGRRTVTAQRMSATARSLWGSGAYRVALVADGVYVLRR